MSEHSNEPDPENTTLEAYDQSPFAQRARRAACVLAWWQLAPAALLLWAVATGAAGWLLVMPLLAVVAAGVARRRLWAVAALTAEVVIGLLLAIRYVWAFLSGLEAAPAETVAWWALLLVACAGAAPFLVTVLRDQERQHALGRWT